MNATTSTKVEGLLRWSEPKQIKTGRGQRALRTAQPTPSFWALWRTSKAQLQSAGVTVDKRSGGWQVCWWSDPGESGAEFVAQAAAQVFASAPTATANTLPAGVVLSSEQVAIHGWFASGKGNLVVDAKAGTGKTFTIVHGFACVPACVADIYYLVFNKKNQREAREKISDPRVTATTLNACGWKFVRSVWTKAEMPDDKNGNPDVEATRIAAVAPELPEEAVAAVKRLVAFAKNLFVGVPAVSELVQVCAERNVFCGLQDSEGQDEFPPSALAAAARAAMQRALDVLEDHKCIDFGDQVWLPVSKGWVRPCADLVVVDETQDMNIPQLVMVKRMVRAGGRVCVVGDPKQCIYTFRGAHPDGMGLMQRELNAEVLTLSITRRCPKAVVALVQPIVPGYRAADDAPEGSVDLNGDMFTLMRDVRPGDAVLSRANAPMISPCLGLLRKGVPARIEGRDIGRQLVGMVKSLKAKSVPDFMRKLERWADKQKQRIAGKNAAAKCAQVDDQRDTLKALAEGCANVAEVEARIRALFVNSDDEGAKPAVVFSSVHKAKGLEWDRVYLLRWTFNKSWKGQTDDQKREEENIYYVACTRAKRSLAMVAEEYRPQPDAEGAVETAA